MIFSISNIAWERKDSISVSKILRKYDINHIDVSPLQIVDSVEIVNFLQLEDFKNFWLSRGFFILGMQSLFYERQNLRFFQSENSVQNSVEYFSKVAKLARNLGVKSLVFGSPRQRVIDSNKDSTDLIFSFFKSLSSICTENEMVLCLEPNSSTYGTNFLTTTFQTVKFIEKLSLPSIMMNFDTGCDLMNNINPVDSFLDFHEIIGHIHISSPNLMPIDEKTLDHKKLSEELRKKYYNKGVSIEMLNRDLEKRFNNIETAAKILNENYMKEIT